MTFVSAPFVSLLFTCCTHSIIIVPNMSAQGNDSKRYLRSVLPIYLRDKNKKNKKKSLFDCSLLQHSFNSKHPLNQLWKRAVRSAKTRKEGEGETFSTKNLNSRTKDRENGKQNQICVLQTYLKNNWTPQRYYPMVAVSSFRRYYIHSSISFLWIFTTYCLLSDYLLTKINN